MHRRTGQPELVEAWLPEKMGQNQKLEAITGAVDWERLGHVVEGVYSAPEGRPSYPPLLMVKVLLLEQWYTLSDPQMEEALGDRLSFRRFVGWAWETRRQTIPPSAGSALPWGRSGARTCSGRSSANWGNRGWW